MRDPGHNGKATRRPSAGRTLASSVYDRLRDDILSGELEPGEKLRVEFLRERYRVGNSPVREALNRLSAGGWVIREDQKGFSVSTVSKGDLLELIKTRCWLEETALRESIRLGGDEWEEAIVLAFHRLSRVPRSSSGTTFVRNPNWESLHRTFHMSLIAACESRWLCGFCEQLSDRADRYRQLAARVAYSKRNALEEHRAIMGAAVNRRAGEAVELLFAHYHKTANIILQSHPILAEAD